MMEAWLTSSFSAWPFGPTLAATIAWLALVAGPGGAEVVGEPAGAFGDGQEVLDLLIGEIGGEIVGVVVGPPPGQLAPGLDERPHRVAHRFPLVGDGGKRS